MKLPEVPNIGPKSGAAEPQVKASTGAAPAAASGKASTKNLQVADKVAIGPSPKPAAQDVKLVKREVEADYRILKSIIHRQLKSGEYPPLENVDKLAKMMTAGLGR
jgi:hypothetical protein